MSVADAFTDHGERKKNKKSFVHAVSFVFLSAIIAILTACGTSSKTQPVTTPPPSQPSYPSTPPLPITWSPQADPTVPAPAATVPPPYNTGSNDYPLTVTSPTDGETVTSPTTVIASATPTNPIFFMRIYVDDQYAAYYTFTNSIDTQLFLAPGAHKLEVMAEDNQGYVSSTILNVTVSSQSQTTISDIQTLPGWQSCSATFPTGSGRDGQICAAGLGTADSTMTQNQSTPAMDGKSAKFSMGTGITSACPQGYCNMLYFNPVAGGNSVSHFIYDLYFYIDNPTAAQALEFDINQTFGGNRWVWGSECNFNGSGDWDIWDDVNGWKPTSIPCTTFPANTWIHLVWNVERVGSQVHYISLTVGDQTYNVDTYYSNQAGWTLEEIDVAFQMDGNYKQEPYNVWLDKVNLTAY